MARKAKIAKAVAKPARIKTNPNSAKDERQAPWTGRRNYNINSETVLRDAYRLLSLMSADDTISNLSESERDPLAQVRDQFVEDELVHLLIAIAVMNRSQDDHMQGPRKDTTELSIQPLNHSCGKLLTSSSKAKDIDLSFREACNKIIHADKIEPITLQQKSGAFPALKLEVRLKGQHNKKEWKAVLNVPEYVRATALNFGRF